MGNDKDLPDEEILELEPNDGLPMPDVIYAGRSLNSRDEDGNQADHFLWLSYEQVPEGYPPYTRYVRADQSINRGAEENDSERLERLRSMPTPEGYPANWHLDSSLKTWFPYTYEELNRLRVENQNYKLYPNLEQPEPALSTPPAPTVPPMDAVAVLKDWLKNHNALDSDSDQLLSALGQIETCITITNTRTRLLNKGER